MLEVVERRGWDIDIHGVSALHHLDPPKIARDVDRKLADLTQRYERVVIVYGDCGTGGALDSVIAKYPAARPAGVHCYQWFLQEDPQDIVDNRTGTYFLTDWLIRNWDLAVMKGLGLDRYPQLKDVYFGNLTDVLYLRQSAEPNAELEAKAREIASYMGLAIEVKDTGVTPLEALLVPLVEEDADVHA
ncbi:MAG: DUF1638 domain-containing protein [Actinomycetota bacterium]